MRVPNLLRRLSSRQGSIAGVLLCVLTTVGVWAALQIAKPPDPEMVAMLPQGALLTIEAKDFAGVLKRWIQSPEQAAWLKSSNYDVFSRSRLFGRLGDAQGEFARAAGLPPDVSFLNEVAGTRSVFAWYDIGNLEFLYITQLPSGAADKTRLMQLRGKFETRQVAGHNFYVRTSGADGQENVGQPRTVAFAAVGDWLLLATREDLISGALALIASQNTGKGSPDSLASSAWFSDAKSAAGTKEGDLRMTLNLDKIVPSPYFRSYWVQRNVTEMKQYRSAVSDLYIGTGEIREERVLLPRAGAPAVVTSATSEDLTRLSALLPARTGVFRAVAMPDADAAVASLDEKLLARGTGAYADPSLAPAADVAVASVGSVADLETRIDAPDSTKSVAKTDELAELRGVMREAGLTAMMTVDRTDATVDGVWVPFHSAAVLQSSKGWDADALQGALRSALGRRLSTNGMGLTWRDVTAKKEHYSEIGSLRPMQMAVRGNICIVADDRVLLGEMLDRLGASPTSHNTNDSEKHARIFAGMDLSGERANFSRWSRIVDASVKRVASDDGEPGGTAEPAFFAGNIRSLGNAFSSLESERFEELVDGTTIRQTVTYAWKH